jgi:hypothetical protein
MLPDPLTTYKDLGLSSAVVYNLIESGVKRTVRSAEGLALGLPWNLTISHQQTGKNMDARDRHLIRLDRTYEDSDSDDGVITGSVYAVIDAPRRIFTSTELYEMWIEIHNILTMNSNAWLLDILENQS